MSSVLVIAAVWLEWFSKISSTFLLLKSANVAVVVGHLGLSLTTEKMADTQAYRLCDALFVLVSRASFGYTLHVGLKLLARPTVSTQYLGLTLNHTAHEPMSIFHKLGKSFKCEEYHFFYESVTLTLLAEMRAVLIKKRVSYCGKTVKAR